MKNRLSRYSLFIDESGLADLTDHKYTHFLLTSIAIPNSELDEVSGYFTFIKRKYNLSTDVPFHTYELLEGSKKMNPSKAQQFVDSMCEFIELTPLKVWAVHTNKKFFRKEFRITSSDLKGSQKAKEKRGVIYYLSALKQLELFTEFLEDKEKLGFIHVDSRTYQDMELLKSFWAIKQEKRKGGKNNPYFQPSRKRLVSLTFAEKRALSSGVEIADFISFILFARTCRRMSSFKEIQLNTVWETIQQKTTCGDLMGIMGKTGIRKYL